jgi:putative aminopeptidase FrvX
MNKRELLDSVQTLTRIAAPSGHEDRLTAFVADALRERGITPVVDRLGQVVASVGPETGPVAMISAHLDELGLIVRRVEPDGWVRVERLGGIPERVLPGLRMVVHAAGSDLPAVVGLASHHLTPPEDKYIAKIASELYLDIGAASAEEAKRFGVRVGDPVTYAPAWEEAGESHFSAKTLDDRVGVAALLALADRFVANPPGIRVHLAFSTLEEYHLRATLALVERLKPDAIVNVDITPATDTPELQGRGNTALGAGPSVSRYSFHGRGTLGGLIPHPGLLNAVDAAAAACELTLQEEALVGIITDAAFLPMASAEGIAAVGVGIPVRYTHTPIETADVSDLVGLIDLLAVLPEHIATMQFERGAGTGMAAQTQETTQ